MKKDEILVYYGKNWKEMTKSLLAEAKLAEMIPSQDTTVAIKPNLLGPVLAEEGGTTHTEVVAGLIEYLEEHSFSKIEIMEGSWVGDRTSDSVMCCGYDRLCEKYGVPFFDMQKERGIPTDCAGMTLNICEKALEPHFLINVPVLKGHCQTRMTCALKNMKGLLPNAEKRRFHRMGLHDPIGHLSAGIRQDFILVDSICGDLSFEDGGNPVQQDRIYAGTDPVLIDAFGCSLLGLDAADVSYIGIAQSLGIGSADLNSAVITVHGQKSGMSRGGGMKDLVRLKEIAQDVDSCSACYGALIPALYRLDEEGLLKDFHEKICIGQGYKGKTGKLGVGLCTAHFEHTLKGCPPDADQMYSFLKDYIQSAVQQT